VKAEDDEAENEEVKQRLLEQAFSFHRQDMLRMLR
jgi:hypothetical protein